MVESQLRDGVNPRTKIQVLTTLLALGILAICVIVSTTGILLAVKRSAPIIKEVWNE